jgi:hypothetical protein
MNDTIIGYDRVVIKKVLEVGTYMRLPKSAAIDAAAALLGSLRANPTTGTPEYSDGIDWNSLAAGTPPTSNAGAFA